MSRRITLGCFVAGLLLCGRLSSGLQEAEVSVVVSRQPTAATLRQEIRVSAAEHGAQRLTIGLTNTFGAELSLTDWKVEFPWVGLTGSDDRLSTGVWHGDRHAARPSLYDLQACRRRFRPAAEGDPDQMRSRFS